MTTTDRLQNLEAEVAVLGAILLDSQALQAVVFELTADDFTKPAHRAIYKAILRLSARKEPADLITLTVELKAADILEACGGEAYVSRLTSAVPSAANVEYYVQIVRDCSLRRRTQGLLEEALKAVSGPESPSESLESFLRQAEKLLNGNAKHLEPLRALSVEDVFGYEDPAYTIDKIVLNGGITSLTGAPGSLKSWSALGLTRSVVTGLPFLGCYRVLRTGPVLYVDEETPTGVLKNRVRRIGITAKDPVHFLHFAGIRLDNELFLSLLLKVVERLEPVLVVFDALTRMHRVDENSASEMSVVMAALRKIANTMPRPGVVILHHHGKGNRGRGRYRGSSEIQAAVDIELSLTKIDDLYVLEQVKARLLTVTTVKIEIVDDGPDRVIIRPSVIHADVNSEIVDCLKALLENKGSLGVAQLLGLLREHNIRIGETKLRKLLRQTPAIEEFPDPEARNKYLYRPRREENGEQ